LHPKNNCRCIIKMDGILHKESQIFVSFTGLERYAYKENTVQNVIYTKITQAFFTSDTKKSGIHNVISFPATTGRQLHYVISFPATTGRQLHYVISFPATPGRQLHYVFLFPATTGRQLHYVFHKNQKFFTKLQPSGILPALYITPFYLINK
jgi:hypothetical protein